MLVRREGRTISGRGSTPINATVRWMLIEKPRSTIPGPKGTGLFKRVSAPR